jgi:hypothetical protein
MGAMNVPDMADSGWWVLFVMELPDGVGGRCYGGAGVDVSGSAGLWRFGGDF